MVNEPVCADEKKTNCKILNMPTKDHGYLVMTERIMPGDQLFVDYGLGTSTAIDGDSRCCVRRSIILNPLHERMPRIPILIQGTCLTFSCDDFVLLCGTTDICVV